MQDLYNATKSHTIHNATKNVNGQNKLVLMACAVCVCVCVCVCVMCVVCGVVCGVVCAYVCESVCCVV